jgi:hypothetical protein
MHLLRMRILPRGRMSIQVPVSPADHLVTPGGLAAPQSANRLRHEALQHLYWTPRGYGDVLYTVLCLVLFVTGFLSQIYMESDRGVFVGLGAITVSLPPFAAYICICAP